jgi:hypothetical protein
VYKFLGLYTFGPDKGDSATFGYDEDIYPNLLIINKNHHTQKRILIDCLCFYAKTHFFFL